MSKHHGNLKAVPSGMQREKLQCQNGCTHNNSTRYAMWPIGQNAPKVYCRACQIRGDKRGPQASRSELVDFQARMDWKGPEVTIYRPGDDGFDERAAECTPIGEVKNTGYKAAFVFSADDHKKATREDRYRSRDA